MRANRIDSSTNIYLRDGMEQNEGDFREPMRLKSDVLFKKKSFSNQTLDDEGVALRPNLTTHTLRSLKYDDETSIFPRSNADMNFNICDSEFNMDFQEIEVPSLDFGAFRIAPNLYDDIHAPYTKFRHLNDLELTEDEEQGILSVRMVAIAIKYLSRVPLTGEVVCMKLELMGMNLRDLSVLRFYPYLIYLNLQSNFLKELNVLGYLPQLQHLSVNNNLLTELLDYDPPQDFLTVVHFKNNLLTKIGDLAKFWSIVDLDLSYNKIKYLKGLEELKYLRTLNLSNNQITQMSHLDHLRLVKLDLSNNQIFSFDVGHNKGLHTLPDLEYLDLDNNNLTSMRFLSGCTSLVDLRMRNNNISNVLEPSVYMKDLNKLHTLDLRDNPIGTAHCYKYIMLNLHPVLISFDGKTVSSDEHRLSKLALNPTLETAIRHRVMHMLYIEQLALPTCSLSQPVDDTHIIIILVGQEGVGKATIAQRLVDESPSAIHYAKNYSTSDWVDDEIRISRQEFDNMLFKGELLSFTDNMGNMYGLSRKQLRPPNREQVIVVTSTLVMALILAARGLKAYYILLYGQPPAVNKRLRARNDAHTTFVKNQAHSMMRLVLSDSLEDYLPSFPSIEDIESESSLKNESITSRFKLAKNSLHTLYYKKLREDQGFFSADDAEELNAFEVKELQEIKETIEETERELEDQQLDNDDPKAQHKIFQLKKWSDERYDVNHPGNSGVPDQDSSYPSVHMSVEGSVQPRVVSTAMKHKTAGERQSKMVKFGAELGTPKISKRIVTVSEEEALPKSISGTLETIVESGEVDSDLNLWTHFIYNSSSIIPTTDKDWAFGAEFILDPTRVQIAAEEREGCFVNDCNHIAFHRANPGFFWTAIQTDDLDAGYNNIKRVVKDLLSNRQSSTFADTYNDKNSTIIKKKLEKIRDEISEPLLFN